MTTKPKPRPKPRSRNGHPPETPTLKFPTPDFKGGETRDAWVGRVQTEVATKTETYIVAVREWQTRCAAKTRAAGGNAVESDDFQGGGGTGGGDGDTGGW